MPIDYRIVPGSFPNPVVSVGVCYTAVDAAPGGVTTGWWAVVLECFSSHPLMLTGKAHLARGDQSALDRVVDQGERARQQARD